jgi:hypothetical protein
MSREFGSAALPQVEKFFANFRMRALEHNLCGGADSTGNQGVQQAFLRDSSAHYARENNWKSGKYPENAKLRA